MINAALTATLNSAPTLRMVKNGELALWSCFAKAGTDSVKLTAFGELAETLGERRLDVGDALVTVGRITLESWQSKDGTPRHALAIVMSKAEVLAVPELKPRSPRGTPSKAKGAPMPHTPDFDDAMTF